MSTHTTGPWIAKSGVTQMCHSGTTVARGRAQGDEGAFWWIFSVDGDAHGDAEADARLIAAGPLMYEYISKRASEGDDYAASIIAAI